ncbi:FMRFamide peptide receptor frpr-18-like [Tubulanus polymorphus]|uniref:FMRFamide peptide receptor frpr-18-like n=1 Tax=Tubulanus polymorphus TaxID=672921 RepID=UPI003DA534B8
MASNNSSDVYPYVKSFSAVFIQDFPTSNTSNQRLFLYFFPVIFVFGIVGNTLSFCVMYTARMRRCSYSYYLSTLAVFDSGMLVFNALAWVNAIAFMAANKIVVTIDSDIRCKVMELYSDVFMMGSSWTVVIVTLERLVIVLFPFKGRIVCTPKFARGVVAAHVLVVFAMSPWTASSTHYVPGEGCYRTKSDLVADYTFSSFLYIYIPIILTFGANFIIIAVMCRSSKFGDSSNKSNTARRVTCTILTISITFLCLVLPLGIIAVMFGSAKTQQMRDKLATIMDTCRIVLSLNYCTNFYLYLITGKEIRKALVGLCRRGNDSSGSATKAVATVSSADTSQTSRF